MLGQSDKKGWPDGWRGETALTEEKAMQHVQSACDALDALDTLIATAPPDKKEMETARDLWESAPDVASIFGGRVSKQYPMPKPTPPPSFEGRPFGQALTEKPKRFPWGTVIFGSTAVLCFCLLMTYQFEYVPWVVSGGFVSGVVLMTGSRHDWHWRPVYNRWLKFRKGRQERAVEYKKETALLKVALIPVTPVNNHGLTIVDEEETHA